jgi:hypothetical protein
MRMSDTEVIERDARTGRFLAGNIGGGRKPGARGKLSQAFLEDVHASWEKHGAEVLDRVAREEPSAYLRALVMLMPKDLRIDATIGVNAATTLEAFRAAVQALGNEPPPRPKVIDAARS